MTNPATTETATAPAPRIKAGKAFVAMLVLMSMIGPLALNIAMPVLPTIQVAFGTTRENATLVLSLFLVSMAISQLVLGPFADRFGRKPVLVWGLVLYIGASIWAALAPSIEQLLVARVLQAFGANVGLPLARTIIRDVYDREKSASMIGYVTMAMVVAPMVSPFIGAHASDAYGWHAIFWICAVVGVIALAATLSLLPETRPAMLESATWRDVWDRSVALLGQSRFIGYSGATACASGMFFAFQAGAPFLVIDTWGWPKTTYALWFMLNAGAYMIGNFLSGRYAQRIGIDRMVNLGNWIAVVGCAILLLLALVPIAHPGALFFPMALIAFSNGVAMPSAIAGAVSVDVKAAGAASGLAGFIQSTLSAAASFLIGAIVTTSAVPVGVVMVVLAIVGVIFGRIASRP